MFEKLIANLPYNPSLVHQLGFYARRMRGEASIRRTGFVFIVLSFLIQFFAVVSPPQPTVAASNNDLVYGGFNSAAQAASDCSKNVQNYGTILANYGISCSRVASAPTLTINSRDWGGRLYSMGRLPYNIAGEAPVTIGNSQVYVRYLWGWDKAGTSSTYQALNVTSAGGQTFLLLYNCGNLTSVGFPVQIPRLSVYKTTSPGGPAANSEVRPGDVISYRPFFNNTGGQATNVVLSDAQPAHTTYVWMGSGASTTQRFDAATHTAIWTYSSVPAGRIDDYTDVKFKVDANTPNGTKICNVATLSATGVSPITSSPVCVTVKVSAPKPPVTPTPTKSCEQALSSQDTIACIVPSKAAANLTQHIQNADGTTAAPGDTVQYTLSAKNTGTQDVTNYIFREDMSDVLDYAKVANLGGGSMNSTGQVVWPAMTVKAGQTATKQITVTIDDPIPATPPSSSDPQHYNNVMTNFYGNYVNIKVPTPAVTTVATTATSLPNTGPGSSLIVAGIIVIIAGYFFARARLLADESTIVLQENATGGM